MKKKLRYFIIFFFLFSFSFLTFNFSFAATCNTADCSSPEDCQQKIKECEEIINAYQPAQEKNKEQLVTLEKQINNLEKLIKNAEEQIKRLEKEILVRSEKLESQREIFNTRVRNYYIRSQYFSPFLIFLASENANVLTRELSYRLAVANEDKKLIIKIAGELAKLEEDKQNLAKNKNWLAKSKENLNKQFAFLKSEIEKVDQFLGEVKGKIAALSARQKALLSARAGTFTSSVGEVPVSSIPCSGPPGSPTYCDPGPGNWFAAFSFGAWTHRKGLSQYGAKGRAEAGQNYKEILRAYYGREPVKKDIGGTISVIGFGELDFEYYLLGIAEMPSSWHSEALKAQAVAARSYAYRYKQQGKAICTTQACQVFSKSKADNPPAEWRKAVEETRGEIVEEVIAFYSSTAGGYLTYPSAFWDTTDGQGGPGFASRAWESKGGSPWFYSSWYTQSYKADSPKCGRSHPWLSEQEMADILNAWFVLNKQGGDERILPVTINQCPVDGGGGNPYSLEELKNKAQSLGGAFTNVNSVRVVYSNNGETAQVIFQTNKGEVNISGQEFKQAFNLRAPGYIAIRSPLFNVEKK
ncbi:MAG: SpoIID/LytB domain-containing protein [Microgenomates group bacterium]